MATFNWPNFLILVLSLSTIFVEPINGSKNQRKLLDEETSIKCGCSSCNPCVTPSPPPPALPPPPPACPPPPPVVVLPPPPPKKPPTPSLNCPPPPSSVTPYSPFIFVPGPPGNLYPIYNNLSWSERSLSGGPLTAVIFGLVGLLIAFW